MGRAEKVVFSLFGWSRYHRMYSIPHEGMGGEGGDYPGSGLRPGR